MYDNKNQIKEVQWESIKENKCGEINFRTQRNTLKKLIKLVAFVLIAVFSGIISSNYVMEKKYSEIMGSINKAKATENKEYDPFIKENAISKVAESVGPAVVRIINTSPGALGDVNRVNGSGIIFDSNGYIVTNYHITKGASELNVKLASGGSYLRAKLIGVDATSDLAIIKIDGENLPVAKFGDSSKVKVGDIVVAVGSSLGDEFSGGITAGIISDINKKIKYGNSAYKVLQTDAKINSANSGGALCNLKGEVIGINSFKLGNAQFENIEGVGFAITINQAQSIINQIMKYGKVARPDLGIYGKDAISEDSNGIKGVYVNEVIKNSGAEKAGVRPTDIITKIDNKKITTFTDISEIMEEHKIGDMVKCKVWRKGKIIDVNILLSDIKE